ncbi:hypothetical protein EVAR_79097_1 [Eumeta japonica]|uniref:Uncharacterized protein n=1 Tax=Eumeta variegata TaxID=151549 RepID=A0A4C1WZX7_EUMVA|nr:hypothetical protein EVAR_79097_1 [Eumeta japonica]
MSPRSRLTVDLMFNKRDRYTALFSQECSTKWRLVAFLSRRTDGGPGRRARGCARSGACPRRRFRESKTVRPRAARLQPPGNLACSAAYVDPAACASAQCRLLITARKIKKEKNIPPPSQHRPLRRRECPASIIYAAPLHTDTEIFGTAIFCL